VYRRALRRFATSIVFTILNLAVCALMIHWVAERKVSPAPLLLIVPLALTLANMWRCTVGDLLCIDSAISSANTDAAVQATIEV
jgi:hypothetical protein